jgi:hypothetical protein
MNVMEFVYHFDSVMVHNNFSVPKTHNRNGENECTEDLCIILNSEVGCR